MNPFNALGSLFQYLRGNTTPTPRQEGGGGLLLLLAYLLWNNSSILRRNHRMHPKCCACKKTRRVTFVDKMDTIFEEDETRDPTSASSLGARSKRTTSTISDTQVRESENQHTDNDSTSIPHTNPSSCSFEENNSDQLVTFRKTKSLSSNLSDESYTSTSNRRRYKVTPKRLQKKTGEWSKHKKS